MSITEQTIEFVKQTLAGAEGGHDWWHTLRVLNNTRKIAKAENVDSLVCELAALLHDIADPKFHNGDETKGSCIAKAFLEKHSLPEKQIAAILDIIDNISFSKSSGNVKPKSPELMVVQDADRLDAMGAIGIARAFNYGGFKNREIYNPEIPLKTYSDSTEYRNSSAPTINHFYEKLLLLKDLMNTKTGKELANRRHDYMVNFLKEFFEEWGIGGD